MDPINIIAGLNLLANFGANLSGAKKGLRSTITVPKEKPATYLQNIPIVISTIALIAFALGLFRLGTFEYNPGNFNLRLAGLAVYLVFSWMQIWSYKTLGENYSQDIVIFKSHSLVKKGPYKYLRHPQYTSQILMDAGAGVLSLSYIVIILVIIEIPLLIMRASAEEKLLAKHLKDYNEYKKQSGSFLPFIG
jgi:protein-S-isoprenylcysteine O-methyltransferase Ste14